LRRDNGHDEPTSAVDNAPGTGRWLSAVNRRRYDELGGGSLDGGVLITSIDASARLIDDE